MMEAQVREISSCYALALKLESSSKSMTEAASRSWTRQGKRFSSSAFRVKAALPTSWFLSQWDLFHGHVRQWICAVLSDPVGGNLLQQQQQERNTVCSHERSSQRGKLDQIPQGYADCEAGGRSVTLTWKQLGRRETSGASSMVILVQWGAPETPSIIRKVTQLRRCCLWLALDPTQ